MAGKIRDTVVQIAVALGNGPEVENNRRGARCGRASGWRGWRRPRSVRGGRVTDDRRSACVGVSLIAGESRDTLMAVDTQPQVAVVRDNHRPVRGRSGCGSRALRLSLASVAKVSHRRRAIAATCISDPGGRATIQAMDGIDGVYVVTARVRHGQCASISCTSDVTSLVTRASEWVGCTNMLRHTRRSEARHALKLAYSAKSSIMWAQCDLPDNFESSVLRDEHRALACVAVALCVRPVGIPGFVHPDLLHLGVRIHIAGEAR